MKTFTAKMVNKTPNINGLQGYAHRSPQSRQHQQQAEIRRILGFDHVQAKLTIGQANDHYEQQADQFADLVMRMPEPMLMRQSQQEGAEEVEEQTLQTKPLADNITPLVQRQAESDEEEEMLQAEVMPGKMLGPPSLEPIITNSLRQGGEPLDTTTRRFFEPRFGYDFSHVRVHSDSAAATSSKLLNARAFTLGHHIAMAPGQYQPDSPSGRRLLGHELTHVIQQNANPVIQRKILIGGKYYIPKSDYGWIEKAYGKSMVEFLKRMHNKGNPPEFNFDNFAQMHREVRLRANALRGMEEVNTNGSVNYGSPHRLNKDYWDKVGATHFTVKSTLPSGKSASDAIESIFEAGADNRLECNSLMVAVQYRGMLKGLGKTAFNKKFPNGSGIIISPHHRPPKGVAVHPIWDKKLYKQVIFTAENELLPGDWVYFKNYGDYITWNPGGLWTGEHSLYMGDGKYQGFGPSTFAGGKSMTKVELEQRLCDKYNSGADAAHQKIYVPSAQVLPSGDAMVGLRNYARRPVIQEIDKP